jgi:hypothetical protein
MGLDWVVIAKEENGVEINPTEVLGAKRLEPGTKDPEVLSAVRQMYDDHLAKLEQQAHTDSKPGLLKRIFGAKETKKRVPTFEEFINELTSHYEYPPVVVPFGEEAKEAIPKIPATEQYYGYRGQALLPDVNGISRFAENKGEDLSWMHQELKTQSEIEDKITILQKILQLFEQAYPHEFVKAKETLGRYHDPNVPQEEKRKIGLEAGVFDFETVQSMDPAEIKSFQEKAAESPCTFADLEAYEGAVQWLTFWKDKGFSIAADY